MLNLTLQPGGIDPTSVYVNDMLTYLRQGDFFLCASERHRDFWLGALLATERLNMRTLADFTIDHLIGIAPLGLPDESPIPSNDSVMKGVIAGIGRDDKVIYWGGGIWDWTDPIALLDALKLVLLQRDDVRIVFGALHHYENKIVPVMSVAQQLMNYAAREGWLNTRIFFLDWVPYDERSQYLLEADIGISLTLRTIENRYAVRARSLDYLWTSLPCILTTGDELADVLKGIGLATQVQPGDVQAIANAILKILGDATPRARFRQQNETVIEAWRWSTLVKATLDFSIHPHLSQDSQIARGRIGSLVQARTSWDVLTTKLHILNQEKFDIQSQFAEVQTEAATLHTQLEQLRKHLNLVERGKVMRTLNALQQGIKKIRGNHS